MHQDYILRMIQQLSGFLIRVTKLREAGQTEQALEATSEAFGTMGGLNASLVHALSEDDLVQLLRARGGVDADRCFALAEILREEASIYDELGQPEEALPRYLKSLRLHLEAFPDPREAPTRISVESLGELIDHIPASALSLSTFDDLVIFLTESGAYALAENVLLERREAIPEDDTVRRIGEAFYRSVLDQPDDGIEAGGLSREEAEEGLLSMREA
jgi:tetratricopeptide (TPR) repeat protein